MTDTSLILGLPYIQPSQAQKHVTHNEALRVLDALVQLSVVAVDQSLPPSNAVAGDRHVVAAPGQGAWAGHNDEIAIFDGITWTFIAPQEGWQAYVSATGGQVVFDGTAWQTQGADMVDTLGINASADTTNRLSVASDAVLLNHAGTGHQVKVNKASATDTASLLFQTGFSGRAEMGLAGNDDFSIKVSADGSTWNEALRIDGATGAVALPQTAWREMLSGPRTYYVDPATGSDANDGLSAGAGAFASIDRAVQAAYAIDAGGHEVTVQLADATYAVPTPLTLDAALVGAARLVLQGNVGAPEQVVLDGTTEVLDVAGAAVMIRGVRLQNTSTSRPVVSVHGGGTVRVDAVDFATAGAHVKVDGAQLYFDGSYSISGGGKYHVQAQNGGSAQAQPGTVTVTGTPDFSTAFVVCLQCSTVQLDSQTFVGGATGQHYFVTKNALIETGGGGETYFPGDITGDARFGGRYF